MTGRQARILGGLWAVVGGRTLIYVASGFWVIATNPREGYNVLPLFLAFIMLPFGIAALVNGIGGLSRGHLSRVLTIILSLVVLAGGGVYLQAATTTLRLSPIPELRTGAIREVAFDLLLILWGLYNLGVMALRAKGGR